MTRKALFITLLTSCCLLATNAVSWASLTQFTIAASSQNVTVQWVGANLDVFLGACSNNGSTSTCTLSGNGLDPNNVSGTYTISTTYNNSSPIDLSLPQVNGVFGINMNGATSTFTFTDVNGTFSSPLAFSNLNDGSPNPHFDGLATAFTTSLNFDFELSTLGCNPSLSPCTIDNLSTRTSGQAFAAISSGEFPTPEPASMLLFGSGLLGLGTFLRRRLGA